MLAAKKDYRVLIIYISQISGEQSSGCVFSVLNISCTILANYCSTHRTSVDGDSLIVVLGRYQSIPAGRYGRIWMKESRRQGYTRFRVYLQGITASKPINCGREVRKGTCIVFSLATKWRKNNGFIGLHVAIQKHSN